MNGSIIDFAIPKISCAANYLLLQVHFKLYVYQHCLQHVILLWTSTLLCYPLRTTLLFELLFNRSQSSIAWNIHFLSESSVVLYYSFGLRLWFLVALYLWLITFSFIFHLAYGHHQALCLCRWIALPPVLLNYCMFLSFDGWFSCFQMVGRPIIFSLIDYCWKPNPPLFSVARPLCSEYYSLVASLPRSVSPRRSSLQRCT